MPPLSQTSYNLLAEATMDQEPEWWVEKDVAELAELDSAFRCPICKDIFDSPKIFKTCHHTFCNLCIIRFLTEGKKCPQCRQQVSTSDLIPNLVLETICSRFRSAREKMVQILKTESSTKQPCTPPTITSSSSSLKTAKHVKTSSTPLVKKKMQTLCYDILSLKQLKEQLKKLNLPTDGDKSTLTKRHREYVLLYNTNLEKPISEEEIRQLVLQNEEYNTSNFSSKKRKENPTSSVHSTNNRKKVFEELAKQVKQRPFKLSKHNKNDDVSNTSASISATKKESSQKQEEENVILLDSSSSSSSASSNRSSLASVDVISLDLSDAEEESKKESSNIVSQVFESRREQTAASNVIPQEEAPLFSILLNSTPKQSISHSPSSSSTFSLDLSLDETDAKESVTNNPIFTPAVVTSNPTTSTANEIMQLLQVELSPAKEQEKQEGNEEIQSSPIIFSTYINSQPPQPVAGSLES